MEAPRCIVCGQKHWSRQPCKLNAVGKPYGENYDPNYKVRTTLTSSARLRAPMPADTQWKRGSDYDEYRDYIFKADFVTKPVTKPPLRKSRKRPKNAASVTKPPTGDSVTLIDNDNPSQTHRKNGRPTVFSRPMTTAERMRRYRNRKKAHSAPANRKALQRF